jgi:hypothetical protein
MGPIPLWAIFGCVRAPRANDGMTVRFIPNDCVGVVEKSYRPAVQ